MGSFVKATTAVLNRPTGSGSTEPPGLRDEFPELADVLLGVAAVGTDPAIGAGTVTLFVRDGRLRFSVSVNGGDVCFFGEVPDASKGLQGVEQVISEGRLGVKHEKRRK